MLTFFCLQTGSHSDMHATLQRRPVVSDTHLADIPSPVLRQIYASRGIQSSTELNTAANALLHYDKLQGVDRAVTLLCDAIRANKFIVIIGDFDADGATSTALSLLSLGMLGSKRHSYLVPNRFDFGYGLSPEIVDLAHEQGAEVIMTVDNGIACCAGVDRANEYGIPVVVTDHHLPGDTLPDAAAIVNPNQPGCEFVSKNLAGVGVAFYLMLAVRARLRGEGWFEQNGIPLPNLAELLDIVALGTVADVVPLDHNNRILVHQGLQRIRSGKCRPGIQALLDVAGKENKRIAASDLGFVLGPRLNAAGRLDDMSLGIECLLTSDTTVARPIAVQLDALNRERREIEQSMQVEAEKALEALTFNEGDLPHGITLYKADYHQGVIGILAGRIKEKFYRPTIAFAHQDDEILKGSARSIPGVHIRDLLEEIDRRFPGLILKFGGHAMAAGLSIGVQSIDEFEHAFQTVTSDFIADKSLAGEILSDGELGPDNMTLAFAQQLKDAGPWGQAFPEPCFDSTFALLDQKIVGGKHLKMLVKTNTGLLLDAIAFNVDTHSWPDPSVRQVHLAYKLDINEFRGKVSLQLLVEAVYPA